jgi:hypothetical protein
MGDTRCADPALQLDVDTMMFEYLLYNAIQSQIRAMEEKNNRSGNNAREDDGVLEATAQRLLTAFECENPTISLNLIADRAGK